ncbi:hypothetical protein GGI21_001388 [Coemansia aciculifera]|nr:hypothetical protein GGI21_001388 [Coemansia aciculifera]
MKSRSIEERYPTGITTADWEGAKEMLKTLRGCPKTVEVTESEVQKVMQAAYGDKLHYVGARWEHRNDEQIQREWDTRVTLERRRQLMREDQDRN